MSIKGNFGLSDARSRIWALAATVAYHAAVVGLLLLMVLDFNRSRDEVLARLEASLPEEREEDVELLLAGQYVTIGDDATLSATTPVAEAPPAPQADALSSSAGLLAGSRPSPAKTAEPNAAARAAEEERRRALKEQEEARQRQAQADAIGQRVKFGEQGPDNPSSVKPGSPDGTATSGAPMSGRPGANLKGRTLARWDNPKASRSGTIVVSVRVDRTGRVTSASYASGTGSVASDPAARRSCIEAARRSSFSVADDAPAEQVGTITYKFIPPSATN